MEQNKIEKLEQLFLEKHHNMDNASARASELEKVTREAYKRGDYTSGAEYEREKEEEERNAQACATASIIICDCLAILEDKSSDHVMQELYKKYNLYKYDEE